MVELRLPALREDLKLLPGSHDEDGAPRWLLHDQVRNRYFTLAAGALALIRHWQPGRTVDEMAEYLATMGGEVYDSAEIKAFIDFLIANNLVLARSEQASEWFYRQHRDGKQSLWRWLLHNYLFVRIPLIRPDPWLKRIAPYLDWLFQPFTRQLVLLLGALGGLLVLRQWDTFTATFLYFFTLEGMLLYGLTLVLVKTAHELGHALVSHRLGCRVASMGVAFLVMLPVLYTDTTDAWKLRSKRDRLRVVMAGVRAELYLALLATFLWSVLPDGALRSAAFFVATTSWVTSVLVNISPFLRFDGYYAFSDILGVENLQQRAFALGRWRLRRWLWGMDDPLPEPVPRARARLLTAYAWGTWVYRFFLFLGIALLVYHFFFKVLGILLFIVEVLWFIAMPIFKELSVWRERRADIRWSHWRLFGWSLPLIALVWALLPLSVDVTVPAVIRPYEQPLFVSEPARVDTVRVKAGSQVRAGELLVQLDSPALEQELRLLRVQMQQVETRLARQATSPAEKVAQAANAERLLQLREQLAGLEQRRERLSIRAPLPGRISDLQPLSPGQWVGKNQPLLRVVSMSDVRLEGMVHEQDLNLLNAGQTGVFVLGSGDQSSLPVRLSSIDISALVSLPYAELGSETGGPVAVRRLEDRLRPEAAHYRVQFSLDEQAPEWAHAQRQPGVVVVAGESRSWLGQQLRRVAAVFIREAGF